MSQDKTEALRLPFDSVVTAYAKNIDIKDIYGPEKGNHPPSE